MSRSGSSISWRSPTTSVAPAAIAPPSLEVATPALPTTLLKLPSALTLVPTADKFPPSVVGAAIPIPP